MYLLSAILAVISINLWNNIPITAKRSKHANILDILRRYPASRILKANPELEPPAPAANSATIAPISDNPADTLRPATTLGIEFGIFK